MYLLETVAVVDVLRGVDHSCADMTTLCQSPSDAPGPGWATLDIGPLLLSVMVLCVEELPSVAPSVDSVCGLDNVRRRQLCA